MRLSLVFALALAAAPLSAAAERVAPLLSAASNFGQGWQPDLYRIALAHGITDFRDAVYWNRVEREDGRFVFDAPTTTWPDTLAETGGTTSLTVNGGHPAYDDGHTPHTPRGVEGFARHAAETVRRFPAIHSVEVGNEFNSLRFTSGIVREASLEARAAYYVALLKETHAQVKALDPEIRILGGGVHSIAAGYLSDVFALGAADYMDALALHPYTTEVEQLVPEIGVLHRVVPESADLPIEATEFGDANPETAPHHLLKSYCQMALAGVSRAVWYPLNVRGDGLTPLFERDGTITGVGRAFVTIRQELEGLPVVDAAPDPFTYACRFGADHLAIWGAPRPVSLAEGLVARDATGRMLDSSALALSMERPLLISGPGAALAPEGGVTLGDHGLVADSYHQFAFPLGEEVEAPGDGFARFARQGERVIPLVTKPGQERMATLWHPYRGSSEDPQLRLTSTGLFPGGWPAAPTEIVHRWTARDAADLVLETRVAPVPRSEDGVRVRLLVNGRALADRVVTEAWEDARRLTLAAGDVVEVAVGPNGTTKGDVTEHRITLRRAE